jgi:hypothetical protein
MANLKQENWYSFVSRHFPCSVFPGEIKKLESKKTEFRHKSTLPVQNYFSPNFKNQQISGLKTRLPTRLGWGSPRQGK